MRRYGPVAVTVTSKHSRLIGLAQARRCNDQCVQYPVQIDRRLADDLEHIARRGQLVHRTRQLSLAVPQLTEQACILHSDDCLCGKILQESDLLLAEQPDLPSCGDDLTE